MDAAVVAHVLWLRWRMGQRDRWTRDRLLAHQAEALAALRAHAVARSPLYRELHAGLEGAPLAALPTVTKARLMERFDDAVTDRRIRKADVEAHLRAVAGDELFLGRYRLNATSGSTGRPGLFLFDPAEWATVLASFARGPAWAGYATGLTRRTPTAFVASTAATHMSSRTGATLRSPMVPTLRLDASRPLAELVADLNAFRPAMLVGYASMVRALADEQLAGRLRVDPGAVFTSSEVLTDGARAVVERAWPDRLFDQYAATETGGVAAECRAHRGKHLFEDLLVVEVVDERNRPAPPGAFGAKLLVTVLWSRTLPLIRYELDDSLRLAAQPCPCGRPYRLIDAVQGRAEDVLRFEAGDGRSVAVQPLVFHRLMDGQPVGGWRVAQEDGGVRVLVAEPRDGFDGAALAVAARAALAALGLGGVRVAVEPVPALPRSASGKARLVVAQEALRSGSGTPQA